MTLTHAELADLVGLAVDPAGARHWQAHREALDAQAGADR